MTGLTGIPATFKHKAVALSLAQLRVQAPARADYFRRQLGEAACSPVKHPSSSSTITSTSSTPAPSSSPASPVRVDSGRVNFVFRSPTPTQSSSPLFNASPAENKSPITVIPEYRTDPTSPVSPISPQSKQADTPEKRKGREITPSPAKSVRKTDRTTPSSVATPHGTESPWNKREDVTPEKAISAAALGDSTPRQKKTGQEENGQDKSGQKRHSPEHDSAAAAVVHLPRETPVKRTATPTLSPKVASSPSPAPSSVSTPTKGSPQKFVLREGTPVSQVPVNPEASKQLWELVVGTRTSPDCASLIQQRADVEFRTGERSQTPLMQACYYGRFDIATVLLKAKASVHAKDLPNEQTPLLYAVFADKSNTNMLDLVINHGADPNGKDKLGYSALMYAVHYGKYDVATYLVRVAGCSLWERGPDGRSSFRMATDNRDQGRMARTVLQASLDRGKIGLNPADFEQNDLLVNAMLKIFSYEQVRQLRLLMKANQDPGPIFVIDNGSCFIRAGLSTLPAPSVVFPTVRGVVKSEVVRGFMTRDGPNSYIGSEALQKKQVLQLSWPLRKDWDMKFLESAWEKAFSSSGIEPSSCAVVITQPRGFAQEGGIANIKAMQQLLFQRFSVKHVSIVHTVAAASVGLYGLQCPCHLSLHVGFSFSTVMAWVEGKPYMFETRIGGVDCTDYLQKNCDWGLGENTVKAWEMVNAIKEANSYCLPFANAPASEEKRIWTLPSGEQLTLGSELAYAAEVLFDPGLIGKRAVGIPKLISHAISAAPAAFHTQLWNNIVVSGASSQFPGFDERLKNELKQLDRSRVGGHCPIRIVNEDKGSCPSRADSGWLGAASLFATPAYFGSFVSTDEHDEHADLILKVRLDGCEALASPMTLEVR